MTRDDYAATTEAHHAADARDEAAAAAMLAGGRWARRPDTRAILHSMRCAARWPGELSDQLLAKRADEAESRAVLAAVLAQRVDVNSERVTPQGERP